MPATQSKYWMWTYNNPVQEHMEGLPDFNADKVGYCVYQLEKGAQNGTLHLQGYIETKTRIRMSGVKELFAQIGVPYGKPHLEARMGTQAEAVTYCTKEDTREPEGGPWTFGEPSECRPGARSDILAMRDAIREKRSFTDMADDDEVVRPLVKYHKAAEMLVNEYQLRDVKLDEFRQIEVIVLHGPTGSGKTRKAVADGAFKYNPSTPEWWDGYKCEKTIVIDEFNGQVKITRLLQLLDGYVCRLPIKGSFSYARWTKVYITSNKHPKEWYRMREDRFGVELGGVDPKHVEAMMRRITEVREVRL